MEAIIGSGFIVVIVIVAIMLFLRSGKSGRRLDRGSGQRQRNIHAVRSVPGYHWK